MSAPIFARGQTPQWTYPCGCIATALALTYCPLHAQAPAMREHLRAGLSRAIGVEDSWERGDLAAAVRALCEWSREARAILRAIEGA